MTADRSSHSDSPQRKGGMALMVATPRADRDPFASMFRAEEERVAAARKRHATMLARTDSAGAPLYRVTRGGNIVRTKPITQRLKAKILKRDGHACVECGATPCILHVAHIEDYRINGNNHPDNLRTLCPECHAAEGGD